MSKTGGWTYSYDYENRLTSVSHNGVKVQSNYYDGDGNRVEQVAGSTSAVYSYQGVNILYQKDLTSDTVTKELLCRRDTGDADGELHHILHGSRCFREHQTCDARVHGVIVQLQLHSLWDELRYDGEGAVPIHREGP